MATLICRIANPKFKTAPIIPIMHYSHTKAWILKQLETLERLATTFGGSTLGLLLASVLISVGMVVLNDSLIVNTRAKTDNLAKLDSLLSETWKTRAHLAVAESAQRGLLLTHSTAFVQPYQEGAQALSQHLHAIDRLLLRSSLSENPHLQTLMNEIITAVSKKSAEMSVAIGFAERMQFDKALAVVKLDDGIEESRKIETLVQEFEQRVLRYREELANERNFSRTLTRVFVLLCPLVFMALVTVVVRRLLRELAEKARLHAQLLEENARSQQNILRLTRKLQGMALQAQTDIERERYELSRELHDELGSLLTAIKMDISWALKSLQSSAPLVTDKLKKTNQYLDRSINFKREVVQALHPAMIKSFGLVASLQNLIDEACARNHWQASVVLPEQAIDIHETLALIVYRIVQESLNNCSKYAQASEISVHLITDEQHIKLEVSDNGVGFALEALHQATHGIHGMRNRVESIGGYYEISSTPGQGVHIRVMLPATIQDNLPAL